MNGDSTYTTDGREQTNSFGELQMNSTAKWEGEALKIQSKGMIMGSEATFEDTWELSEDGKKLTIHRTMSSAMGEAAQVLVFLKE